MTAAAASSGKAASPFSRGAIFAVIVVGFAAFAAMLYFISAGDTGGRERGGAAHAYANGLNGYSGLARMLEAEGYTVDISRGRDGLEASGLLILTPPRFTDPEEFTEILKNREYSGPTLVILPKWNAAPLAEDEVSEEYAERTKSDWVALSGAQPAFWTRDLPEPYKMTSVTEELGEDDAPYFEGLGVSGELPTNTIIYAEDKPTNETVMTDAAGHVLAHIVVGEEGSDYYEYSEWVMFVSEPDLVNNYGMADGDRAAAALALIREIGYEDGDRITFDLTLNGFGDSTNLLTLAFEPPFLAATLCLILAMFIVAWRAFLRFGPAAAGTREIAFGKQRLVSNGAGLIVRARRLGLLAAPYAALTERRLGRMLGIARPDAEAIDNAIAVRLPGEESFSSRAQRMHDASKPIEILRAAQALNDLAKQLTHKNQTQQKFKP